MALAHARPIDGNDREHRAALARMVIRLFELWELPLRDQLDLLGLGTDSRSTITRYRRGEPLAPHRDLIERAGHLMGIHKSLRLLFPQNRDLAYRWMTTRNRAFANLTPVDVVRDYGFAGLLMIRGYLDRARDQ